MRPFYPIVFHLLCLSVLICILEVVRAQKKSLTLTKFEDPRDAEDAMYNLDRARFYGRELEIEFARGDRKTPQQMRSKEKYRGPPPHGRYDRRRRSRSYSPRHRSRSRSPVKDRRRSSSPRRRYKDSPRRHSGRMENSRSRSRSKSPDRRRGPSPRRSKSRSRSRSGSRRRGESPKRDRSKSPQE